MKIFGDFIELPFNEIREATDMERKEFKQIAAGRVGYNLRVCVIVSC